jgi:hypothetical protein
MTASLHDFETDEVSITITRSGGPDGAVLVMIDTSFEPDASDGSYGLRVLLNDNDISRTVAYSAPETEDQARTYGDASLEVNVQDDLGLDHSAGCYGGHEASECCEGCGLHVDHAPPCARR